MTLAPGAKLGPYEILAPLGAGGMGEVYRAKDPKLNRFVAIKVLPDSLASHPEALARFEREAKALAALQHPNVLGIFDFGTEGAIIYAVMELLEGDTLRSLLAAGPPPPRQALDIAVQVAHGLAAAHGKGIVHRDLKPENVIVLKDGRVKLLDFGLAKQIDAVDLDGPTRALGGSGSTEKGTILGTLGYMSPEQVRGEPVDGRSDIFSFGALLYELFTGRRAFARDSAADTLAAILKEDPPDPESYGRPMPPSVRRLMDHCLQKDPARRFQEAQGLAFALESVGSDSGGTAAAGVPALGAGPSRGRRLLGPAAAAAGILLAAWAGHYGLSRPSSPPDALRYELPPPEGCRYGWTNPGILFALSPDGKALAFDAVGEDGQRALWVRPLGELQAMRLAGTEGSLGPFWSPDSRFIGYFAGGKLWKVPATGGPPVALCDVPDPYPSGSWGPRQEILFSGGAAPRIALVPEGGGTPRDVLKAETALGEINVGWPYFLPDGEHFLYLDRVEKATRPGIRIGSLRDGTSLPLLANATRAEFVPAEAGGSRGHILFCRDGNLMAQPFDARGLKLLGEPVTAGQVVFQHALSGKAHFSVSARGVLATRDQRGIARLVWYGRDGRPLGTLGTPDHYRVLCLSRNGQKLVTEILDPRTGLMSLWSGEVARGVFNRVETGAEDSVGPTLSPDGERIGFSAGSLGNAPQVRIHSPRGGPAPAAPRAAETNPYSLALDWSPDDRHLVYFASARETGPGFWSMDPVGSEPPRKLFSNPDSPRYIRAQVSPDGRWLAYSGIELGRPEVFVTSFPEPGERIRISSKGGSHPRWRKDGRELYYVSVDYDLTATALQLGARVEVGASKALFRLSPVGWWDYVAAPDGDRFLVSEKLPDPGGDAIVITTSWESRKGR